MNCERPEQWNQCPRCKQSYSDTDGRCDNCQQCDVCEELEAVNSIRDLNGCECCADCYKTITDEIRS